MSRRRATTALVRRARAARDARRRGDSGMTLVELMVAMTLLIVLLTLVVITLSAYLSSSTTVLSSYSSTDSLLPSSVIIQRLIRSEVEPAPTPQPNVNNLYPTPTPAFAIVSASPYTTPPVATQPGVTPVAPTVYPSASTLAQSSTAMSFYANIGDPNGPAEIIMALSATANPCSGCSFTPHTFTITQIQAEAGTCQYPSTAVTKQIFSLSDVVNTTAPLFTYSLYNSGTPQAVTNFATTAGAFNGGCTGSANLTATCPGDDVQSVAVDLQVESKGSPQAENKFTVFRLSSSSYLYTALVG